MINLMFSISSCVLLDFTNIACSSFNINLACGISRFRIILKSILLGCEIRLNIEQFVEFPFLGFSPLTRPLCCIPYALT